MKKKCLLLSLLSLSMVACSGNHLANNRLKFVSYDKSRFEFDTSLFYANINVMKGADPSLIYVPYVEGDEDSGYYYSYVTGTSSINSWRTKDMTNWQYLGAAFQPNLDNFWCTSNYWAPCVIFDPADGYYYMLYTATWNAYSAYTNHYGSVARSKSPVGPFVEMGNGSEPLFDFAKVTKTNPMFEYHTSNEIYPNGYFSCIDTEGFIDPNTGKKYMLICHDKGAGYSYSTAYIVEMNSWSEPKYETLTRLTECEYTEVGGTERIEDVTVNEGPFMYYHNGLYYLTFSNHMYTSPSYRVRQAVSKSPTGPFRKLSDEEGGIVISTDEVNIYTASSGHHSFINVGGELYIGYHTFLNDSDISEARKIKFDKVHFITNKYGMEVMQADGPSVSLQPLPSAISGYENKALSANVYAQNVKEGSDKYWLNDGTFKMNSASLAQETEFAKGASSITMRWSEPVEAKSIMVYNSRDWDKAFKKIDNIVIQFRDENGKKHECDTGEINFNFDIYSNEEYKVMFAGASSTVQFKDMLIDRIDIFFSESNVEDGNIAIPEVKVLGRA